MVRTICILAGSINTAEAIERQIRADIGGELDIVCHAVDQILSPFYRDALVLISSEEVLEELTESNITFINCQKIVATRVPDHNQFYKLLDIESGERVIVINDSHQSATEGLQALETYGFSHLGALSWYPTTSEKIVFNHSDVAVIFGELNLVPREISKVIDLGSRVVDHFSMIKLMMALDIADQVIQRYSNSYYKQAFVHVTVSHQQKKWILEINAKIENSYFETVKAIALAVDAKDNYTGGHCERVMNYAIRMGEALKLSQEMQNILRFSSILHDVGKIGIPDAILSKPGNFSVEEYDIIKTHSQIGSDIVGEVDFLKKAARIIKDHHERLDGSGYPEGKSGGDIELLARIIAIADAYDAMTSIRTYRTKIHTPLEALKELKDCSGTQFDGDLVEVFSQILEGERT